MENEEFYKTIFKRKSIRKYDPKPLDEEKIDEIKSFTRSLKPLYPDIKTELKIISGEDVKSLNQYRFYAAADGPVPISSWNWKLLAGNT